MSSFRRTYRLRGDDDREVEVRLLDGGDRAAWQPLWDAYLTFYDEVLDDDTTDVVFQRLADPGWPSQLGLVAVHEGALLGFAHLLLHHSTWSVALDAYLEDLFVDPSVRRRHVGEMLVSATTDLLRDRGGRKVHWLTDTDNDVARNLYDQLGELEGQVRYTLEP